MLKAIGTNFKDSLVRKGLNPNQIIVTSVLRTKSDQKRLRRGNGNATENSAHAYATTFDITYKRFQVAIDRLGVKQQFCTFHLKQLINREIREHIKENNTSEEEIEIIHNYKQLFFNIINAKSINEAQEKRNQLFYLESNIPQVIQDLASKLIIPEFKKNHKSPE